MGADGSQREVLTRKRIRIGSRSILESELPPGDSDPSVSPDGSRLAFLRTAQSGIAKAMVAKSSGENPKPVWRRPGNGSFTSIGWAPDGRLIMTRLEPVAVGGQNFVDFEILSVDASGEGVKHLLRRRYRSKFGSGSYLSLRGVQFQDLGADGRLLYTQWNANRSELRIRDLYNRGDRLVAIGGEDAAFSSDGSSVVFTRTGSSGIWTINADGTSPSRVVAGPGMYKSPSFAPDGSRIIFSSTRNFPGAGRDAFEIYSVASDGSCLTWLTNGTPRSIDPVWAPGLSGYAPGRCGAAGRDPLIEVEPSKSRKSFVKPRVWVGTKIGARVLSSIDYLIPSAPWDAYVYGDCSRFEWRSCPRPVRVEVGPTCGGGFGPTVSVGTELEPRIVRGVLFVASKTKSGSPRASQILTGRSTVYVAGAGARSHLIAASQLTLLHGRSSLELEPPRIPRSWSFLAAHSGRALNRFGSVRAAADRLGYPPAAIRFGLKLAPVLRNLEGETTISC